MSSLETRKIEPATGTTVTLGAGGDTVLVSANQLKTNTVKDAGGNTIFTSNGSGTLSSVNSAIAGSMIFISSQTASSSSSLSFTSGIDSTYDEYVFYYVNMNPATNRAKFLFQVNASGQSGFNETMTTTSFVAWHNEADTSTSLQYRTGADQAQGTAYQKLSEEISNASKGSTSGEFHLFSPSSTTYVKHFYQKSDDYNDTGSGIYDNASFTAGYINVTAAITEIDFKMDTGNINAGTIYLYGVL